MLFRSVGFPADLAVEMLGDVLKGGYDKAKEAGCLIVGGHTVDDAEPKYGLSVVGLIEPGKEVSNANAKPGDVLVLTKPIGTGIVTTGVKQGRSEELTSELQSRRNLVCRLLLEKKNQHTPAHPQT